MTDAHIRQAALVPYVGDGEARRFWVVLPVARNEALPPPRWQLCKGGRDGDESLRENALREGEEELGLHRTLIRELADCGTHTFVSADGNSHAETQVFAARLHAEPGKAKGTEPLIADTRWMTLAKFRELGRTDHLPFLEAVNAAIDRSRTEGKKAR